VRIGILLGALIWLIIGCTVIAWSDNIGVETTDGLIVIDDKQKETQADKKKTAP